MKALILGIVLAASPALAITRIPDPTQEQIDSARGFAMFKERVEFNRALFGLTTLPRNCSLEILDPSQAPSRFNYVLYCDGPITICDAPSVHCEE